MYSPANSVVVAWKPSGKTEPTLEDPWGSNVAACTAAAHRGGYSLFLLTTQCVFTLSVLGAVMGASVWAYLNCVPCLIGITIGCFCLCCYAPYLNIPLWFSIMLLVLLGWNFTTGHFSFIWASH